jgi:PAS domain S-box-containing protein
MADEIHNISAQTNPAELYEILVSELPDFAVFLTDVAGTITSWNPGVERILGYAQSEWIGQPGACIFTPEDRAAGIPEREMFDAVRNGRAPDSRYLQRKDGSRLFVEGTTIALKNSRGQLLGFSKVIRDLTERKAGEEALREGEERYRTLFDSIDEGFCILEMRIEAGHPPDFRFIEVNHAFEKQSTLVNAKGKSMRELLPAQNERWFEIYRNVALTGQPIHVEEQWLDERWLELRAFRIGAPEQRRLGVLLTDISERKHIERALRESEERLRLFTENVTDYALLQVDTDARIAGWNTGAERTFGYAETEITGQPMRTLYLPEDAARGDAERDMEIARDSGRFEDARWLVRKDGSRLFARWVTTPMRDDAGNLRGYAKVLRDETERMQAEEKLRKSLAEKHALLQEVHHRVKNNLQVITSLLSIQTTRVDNQDVAAILADTENRVRTIAALHESLYSSDDLARIEFSSYLQRLVQDLAGFYGVDQSRLAVAVRAEKLLIDIGKAIPLGLVVNELITNTFKHAFPGERSGRVEIELEHAGAAARNNSSSTDAVAQLTIRDNGIGLPAELKLDATPSLGLHLVHVLAKQLNAELNIAGHEGTTVVVKFPVSIGVAGSQEHGPNSYR